MLKDYPIQFNSDVLPWPEKWQQSSDVVETVNQTEAGTDQVTVTRYDKLSVFCAFNCSDKWAAKFKAWSKTDSITVSLYDLETSDYKDHTMRIRDFAADPVKYSRNIKNTNGLWEISFKLEEF